MSAPSITRFRRVRPEFQLTQGFTLEWLAQAHTRAERTRHARLGQEFDAAQFADRISRHLQRFGCGEDKIRYRYSAISDCEHTRFDEMQLYRVHENPSGAGMLERSRTYDRIALSALQKLYPEIDRESAPCDLVHVTCTGYAAPSAAQRWVSESGFGQLTRVTHAYHMGCYAALPALRIASGLLSGRAENSSSKLPSRRPSAHIVHTELCTLHMNPLLHDPEQLVVQSLFGDGFIGYEVVGASDLAAGEAGLQVLSVDEWIVPDSAQSMTWICADNGMHMTLARDVPQRLSAPLRAFVDHLLNEAGLDKSERHRAILAIHPGGPRILDLVRDTLERDESAIAESRRVLAENGNMSSATLPHIWMRLLEDPAVGEDRAIVTLAFGPGLTACGAVLRKHSA
ncbi:MAG TPA: 3-oxoacyl-[acyl-carrier-protein] synthase III C-terminal domain-containing protein [Polyangiaceae bacterium]|nr:3-oxoacyl-[acyl-carrier-protein] synthase III C-terminal domain-containing protein [Polyangiaceae bacterium]